MLTIIRMMRLPMKHNHINRLTRLIRMSIDTFGIHPPHPLVSWSCEWEAAAEIGIGGNFNEESGVVAGSGARLPDADGDRCGSAWCGDMLIAVV